MAKKIQETGKGKNTFMVDPRNIEVEEGFNGRENFDRAKLDNLKSLVRKHGVTKPLLVKRIRGTEKFKLVDGERRWIVSNELIKEENLTIRVPVYIFEGNEIDALTQMLISNDGEPFSIIEEAKIIRRFAAHGMSPKQIEEETGRKKAYQLSLERILTVSQPVQKLISSGRVSHTLILEKIKDQSVDLETVFTEIQKIAEENEVFGKKKVTKKQIDKVLDKHNSIAELKAVLKSVDSKEREFLDGVEDDLLIDFSQKLIGNKLSREKLEKLLLKPIK